MSFLLNIIGSCVCSPFSTAFLTIILPLINVSSGSTTLNVNVGLSVSSFTITSSTVGSTFLNTSTVVVIPVTSTLFSSSYIICVKLNDAIP